MSDDALKKVVQEYIDALNPEQKMAATLGEESAVILAAAGSGKTSTLTCRIAYLHVLKDVPAHHILAVTFTNKAAKEMSQRLYRMGVDVKNMWVGTFHGICNKILKYHYKEAGLQKNFNIMDSSEQESFFKRVLRSHQIDPKNVNVKDLLDKINGYKEVGWRSTRLMESKERDIYEMYEKACIKENCVDFGELLLGCYEIFLNHPIIADSYAEKFKHILVDEFQDTNELQYKWLKILSKEHKNVFAVGDDDQCFKQDVRVSVWNHGFIEKKKIKDVNVGDYVVVLNNHQKEKSLVIQKHEKKALKEFVELNFGDKILQSTHNHLFFVKASSEKIKELSLDKNIHIKLYVNQEQQIHQMEIKDDSSLLYHMNDLQQAEEIIKREFEKTFDDFHVFYQAHINGETMILKNAKSLMVGDEVFDMFKGFIPVLSKQTFIEETIIYDLDIEKYHHFFADDILVHNSIYSFRGARPENMNLLKKDYGAKMIKIEKNYRSDAHILDAANHLIKNNKNRQGKNLVPTHPAVHKIKYFDAFNDEEESAFIAQEIKSIRRKNVAYKDICILYRTNSQSRSLEKALHANNIPYLIYGGFRFFDRQEVKHAMSYLKLSLNPKDNNSFLRIINTPARAIGDTAVKKLEVMAQEKDLSLYETILQMDEKQKKKFQPFIDTMTHLENMNKGKNLRQMMENVIIHSGLENMYEQDKKDGPERLDNLYELLSAAQVFMAENSSLNQDSQIDEFISYSSLESDVNSDKKNDKIDAVKMMTVHMSKGLEFDTVFIAGLEEALFPHANSIGEPEAIEEERRLMYVALTRARKNLYLSTAEERMIHGMRQRLMKSRFLKEIPSQSLERYR